MAGVRVEWIAGGQGCSPGEGVRKSGDYSKHSGVGAGENATCSVPDIGSSSIPTPKYLQPSNCGIQSGFILSMV